MRNSTKSFLFGLLGGVIGAMAITSSPVQAGIEKAFNTTLEVFNKKQQRVAFLGASREDQGALFLFNPDGQLRAQMGTYPSGSEKDQALFGLHDRSSELRYLVRLHGERDSPVIVLKDKYGIDKLIIGLNGEDEAPYIRYMGSDRIMHDLLLE